MEPCRRGKRAEKSQTVPGIGFLRFRFACFLQQNTQPANHKQVKKDERRPPCHAVRGRTGRYARRSRRAESRRGVRHRAPPLQGRTDEGRIAAGAFLWFFGRKFALAFRCCFMAFVCIASWCDVPKRMGFFKRAVSWRIESFIEHMNLFLARVRAPHRKYHSEVMLKLLISLCFALLFRPVLIVDADADAHRPFPSMRVFFGILQSLWDQNTRMDWNFRREIRVRAEIIQIFAHFFRKCVRNFCARMDFPTVNGTHIRIKLAPRSVITP